MDDENKPLEEGEEETAVTPDMTDAEKAEETEEEAAEEATPEADEEPA